MKFLKQNSYDIVKLFINQIGITILHIFLFSAVSAIKDKDAGSAGTFYLLVSIFAVCFYLYLVFAVCRDIGAKDKIRIEGGKMEPVRGKGILLGLFANSLNYLLLLIMIVSLLVGLAFGAAGATGVYVVANVILRVIYSMYTGIINVFIDALDESLVGYLIKSIMLLVSTVFGIISCGLGYYLGVTDKRLVKKKKK